MRMGSDSGNKINVIKAPGYLTPKVKAAASELIFTKVVVANKTVNITITISMPVTKYAEAIKLETTTNGKEELTQ